MNKPVLTLCFALLLAACGPSQKKEKNVLTVTIEPQRYFLEQIVGDKFRVNTLVPPGTSPETYEPSPSAMIALGNSRAYLKVGHLGYENVWTDRLKQNNPDVAIVDCSAQIDLLYGGHGHHHHDHGHHAHGPTHHHAEAPDPHVWSSAKNALRFTQNMLEAVLHLDSAHAQYYRANYAVLARTIQQTDSTLTDLLRDIPSRSFIIYHPALAYFARDYGLEQHTIEFEGKNPSPEQMKKLVDLAKADNITTVFIQQEFDVKNTEVIAREIGAQTHQINPLAYQWDEELIRMAKILAGKNGCNP